MVTKLNADQIKVVDMMNLISRNEFSSKAHVITLFHNFLPAYTDEVIPEGTKSKKYINHERYQPLTFKYEGLREAFMRYRKYNSFNKDLMISAFVTGDYETEILFKRRQIVKAYTNCITVGFVGHDVVDGVTTTAKLYTDSMFKEYIGEYPVEKLERI